MIDKDMEREYMVADLGSLQERHGILSERMVIATRRAKMAGTDAAKVQAEELRLRVQTIRGHYAQISTVVHPNIVIANLSALQGQEREALDQLRAWEAAKDVEKELALELELCEYVISEKQKRGGDR